MNAAAGLTSSDLAGAPGAESIEDRLARGIESRTIRIERGERIAQLVFTQFERPAITVVDAVSPDTGRGEGGFGSTGTG